MSLSSGLIHYWKLDENTSGDRLDSISDTTITNQGAGVSATQVDGGRINRGAVFARSDYLESSSGNFMDAGDNPFSVSIWVNADVWNAGGSTLTSIISKFSSAGNAGEWLIRSSEAIEANGRFEFLVRNSGDSSNVKVSADTFGDMEDNTGEWLHLFAAHDPDNDEIKIAVNAGGFDTVPFTGGIQSSDQTFPLTVGARDGDVTTLFDTKYDGIIDEIGIWDRVLSSGEVNNLYNNGAGLALENFDPTIPTAPSGLEAFPLSDTQILLEWTDHSTNENNFVVERSIEGPSTGFSTLVTLGQDVEQHEDTALTAETTYYYRVKATNEEGDSGFTNVASGTTQETPPVDPALTYRLLAHWSMEESGAADTRQDDTDNNIDLFPRNNNTPQGSGLVGSGSVDINGNGLLVASGETFNFQRDNFTIAGWFYANTWDGDSAGQRFLFAKRTTVGSGYLTSWLSTPNRIGFLVTNQDGVDKRLNADNFGDVTSRTGEWLFVAVWHDAANKEIGIQINDTAPNIEPYSSGINANKGNIFGVGARDDGAPLANNFFDGLVDNLGVWTRVLTSGDLNTLYNGGSGLAYPLTGSGDAGGNGNGGPEPSPETGLSSLFLFF